MGSEKLIRFSDPIDFATPLILRVGGAYYNIATQQKSIFVHFGTVDFVKYAC